LPKGKKRQQQLMIPIPSDNGSYQGSEIRIVTLLPLGFRLYREDRGATHKKRFVWRLYRYSQLLPNCSTRLKSGEVHDFLVWLLGILSHSDEIDPFREKIQEALGLYQQEIE